jgi:hypothetical protein
MSWLRMKFHSGERKVLKSVNTDEKLSPRGKFQVKSFLPIMVALEINLKKSAIIY